MLRLSMGQSRGMDKGVKFTVVDASWFMGLEKQT